MKFSKLKLHKKEHPVNCGTQKCTKIIIMIFKTIHRHALEEGWGEGLGGGGHTHLFSCLHFKRICKAQTRFLKAKQKTKQN